MIRDAAENKKMQALCHRRVRRGPPPPVFSGDLDAPLLIIGQAPVPDRIRTKLAFRWVER